MSDHYDWSGHPPILRRIAGNVFDHPAHLSPHNYLMRLADEIERQLVPKGPPMIIKLQHPRYWDGVLDSGEYVVDTERFYFEIQAEGNYATIATSEIYESREAAEHAIALITSADMPHGWTLRDTTKDPS